MVKDPVFHKNYSRVMKKYEGGAAREVPIPIRSWQDSKHCATYLTIGKYAGQIKILADKVVFQFMRSLTRISSRRKGITVKNLHLQSETLPMDRAPGARWGVEKDTIVLVVENKKGQNNFKDVLSSIAAVYNPLGFAHAGPLMLRAWEINQELCRLKVDWNSKLPRDGKSGKI